MNDISLYNIVFWGYPACQMSQMKDVEGHMSINKGATNL